MAKFTWTDELTAQLTASVAGMDVVSQETLKTLAVELETTARSVGSKLRSLDYVVQKASEVPSKSAWEDGVVSALVAFIDENAGQLTYGEIAAVFESGKFSAKQVQGKVLSLEMCDKIKPTEKKAAPRTFTPAEEARIEEMHVANAYLEDVAQELGRSANQIRGKALSMSRQLDRKIVFPKRNPAKGAVDPLEGMDVSEMTVADIAAKIEKTERGVKTMLTRREMTCSDYDGAAKAAKRKGDSDEA